MNKPRVFKCICGHSFTIRLSPVHCKCGIVTKLDPSSLPEKIVRSKERISLLVGNVLKILLRKKYGISSCSNCHQLAERMNKLGVVGCKENLQDLAEQLQSNAVNLNWEQLFSLVVNPKSTIKGAIQATTQGISFFENLILEACQIVENQHADNKGNDLLDALPNEHIIRA